MHPAYGTSCCVGFQRYSEADMGFFFPTRAHKKWILLLKKMEVAPKLYKLIISASHTTLQFSPCRSDTVSHALTWTMPPQFPQF
jgi:hypothetical protein